MRATIVIAVLAFAATVSSAEEVGNGDKILVTATRTAQPADEAPGSVTVIDRDRLSQEAGADIAAVVGAAEGVRVQSYGGPGAVSSLSMRGGFGPHTLVLLDGRTMNAPGLGMADISALSPAFLERIEIVRGPVSALYGAGAVGGVVQLVTLGVPEVPVSESLVALGSFGTVRASVLQGAPDGTGGMLFGIDAFRTDGHRPNSHAESVELFGKVGFGLRELTGRTTVSFGVREGRNGIPGVWPIADPDEREKVLGGPSQIRFGDDEVASLIDRQDSLSGYLQAEYEIRDFRARVSFNARDDEPVQNWLDWMTGDHIRQTRRFETIRPEAEAQNVWRIGASRLLAGAGLAHDRFDTLTVEENLDDGTDSFSDRRDYRTTFSAFTQLELGEGAWQGLAGLRWDEPSDYSGRASGRLMGSWRNDSGLRLEFSGGSAFRAPSLNDLYWPADGWSAGNPDLTPEKSLEGEASLRWQPSGMTGSRLSASVFRRRVDDMIRWGPDEMGVYRPENLDQVDVLGMELGGEMRLGRGITTRLAYTLTDASEKGSRLVFADFTDWMAPEYTFEVIERDLANTPRHQVAFDLEWSLRSLGRGPKVGLSLSWNSDIIQYYETWSDDPIEVDVTYPTKTIDAALLVGLRAAWAWDRGEVFAKVDNLLDTEYALQFGNDLYDRDYPMPGRTVTLGARIRF